MMTPFRLEMRLTTPIVFGDHSPSLDGVIFEFLVEHFGADQTAEQVLPEYLKYTRGVAHASRLFFGTLEDQALIATPVPFINKLTQKQLDSGLEPWGRRKNDPYPRVRQDGGPTRPRLREHNGYWAPFLVFFGVGDVEKLGILFDFYLSSIGSKSRQGFGGVIDIQLIPQSEDESWVQQGRLARFLPVDIARDLGVEGTETLERLVPPFWRKEGRVSGYCPARIQTIFM